MNIILVNREINRSREVTVNLENFQINNGDFPYHILYNLPREETFRSHTNNALQEGTVSVLDSAFTINLPQLSVTAVQLTGQGTSQGTGNLQNLQNRLKSYPNPFKSTITIRYHLDQAEDIVLELYDIAGRRVAIIYRGQKSSGDHIEKFQGAACASGLYFIRLTAGGSVSQQKVLLVK